MRRYSLVLLALCVLCVWTPALADVDSSPASSTTTTSLAASPIGAPPPGVFILLWSSLASVLAALQKGDMWAVLIAICNLIVALLKNEWVQAKMKVWSEKKDPWLTKRMKVALSLAVGIALVALLSPARSGLWYRTLFKGLNVGLCSIGLYSCWKYFIRGEKE